MPSPRPSIQREEAPTHKMQNISTNKKALPLHKKSDHRCLHPTHISNNNNNNIQQQKDPPPPTNQITRTRREDLPPHRCHIQTRVQLNLVPNNNNNNNKSSITHTELCTRPEAFAV
mmetsp:Transcript_34594/g.57963  ORF Transcript_34594/g.57963 Transcript_34594/m.57963 type:complete len:116 (-) Transcript_34594:30-377(-)